MHICKCHLWVFLKTLGNYQSPLNTWKSMKKGMVSEVGRTVWLLMFCLDGRPSFQKFSLSPSYLAEVVLSLSPTTCSTWQEWHSQQCPRRPKVCMDFGWEKRIGIAIARSKKLSDCISAAIAGKLFFFYGCPPENLIFLSVKMLLFCIRRIPAKVIQPARKVRGPEVGWLGVVARAISRKTPIYFLLYYD